MDFQKLNRHMLSDYSFLQTNRNPAILYCTTVEKLRCILSRYWLFPATIVAMLTKARDRAHSLGWNGIVTELDRNIGQEKGSETEGVSHCEMLSQALLAEVSLVTSREASSAGTQEFFQVMFQLLEHQRPIVMLGAVYALESSAVPELRVVLKLVTRLKRVLGNSSPLMATTKAFFNLHLNVWEPSHEQGLRETVDHILDSSERNNDFREGFVAVLQAMETWWKKLSLEAGGIV